MPHVDNLTLGKGKLYFEEFAQGQTKGSGRFRFIGNVPTLTVNQEIESLDHFSSTGGIRVKDRSVTLQNDMGGSFTTDHIGEKNLAMLFQGSASEDTIGSATGLSEQHDDVLLDTYIQLGVTDGKPEGIGGVDDVIITAGADTLTAGEDYDVDEATGLVYLRDDAADLEDGDDIIIHYSTTAGTRSRVVDESREIFGSLKYVADNPVGENRDRTWPSVKISASGDFGLITEEWQTMTFEFEVQKRDNSTPRVIDTGRYA